MTTTNGTISPSFVAGIRTLVFDVLGTVVDETGSIADETATALAAAGADPDRAPLLAREWQRQMDVLTERVRTCDAPWKSNDVLRQTALGDAVESTDLGGGRGGLSQTVLHDLALAGHRLKPWPDSAGALRALAGSFAVVALSNASLAQLADMSAAGGLTWHCVLSSELTKTYKPDPAVYRMALDRLGLDPAQTMMVAAHAWDLRAAARQGMRTAYVSRPGEEMPEPDDRFDVHVSDLADLAGAFNGR